MKRKNTTRNALFTSIISLLLCMSMLVGTTFAWFTDSVVSGNNVIAAGNLDIELLNNGTPVTSSTNLFDDVLWEPGVVVYENFTILNKGNLALLYDFAINWGDYNTLAGQYNLTQVLKVAMIDGHVSGNREAAIAAGEGKWAALDSWSFKGEMTTKGETKDFALIIYWEPSDIDNNWNVQNGKPLDKGDHLYVNLGINLQATQKMHEEDSFGKDYDSLANPWDGSIGEVPEAEENVITITTAAELAAFAESVNNGTTYSGKTVKLGANINLNNQSWTAIGDCESGKYFRGTFDGQGYTIYNLNVDYSTDASEHATAGLFGWVDAGMATIKNVKIDGATVKGSHWVGVIAGYFTGRIENCSVNNATVIGNNVNGEANGDKVGGIVGCLNEHSYLNNNTVSNSTISGNRDIGGIAGSVAASTIEMKNNTVSNTTITYNTAKSYASAGEIVSGRTGYVADNTNVATNVAIVHAIATSEDLAAAIEAGQTEIILAAGEFTADLYSITARDTLSITGQGADTKLKFSNLQVRASQFNNLTISNCTIERMPNKNWGHLVYGSSGNANGVYTISNCIFNGVGSQGIYINETVSGATYNIVDCVFNGDFGKEGAITFENHPDVNVNVNVKGCTFNNIPETSNEIYVHYENKGLNLTVDGKVTVTNAAMLADAVSKGATEIYLAGSNTIRFPSNGAASSIKFVGNGTATLDLTYGSYWESATLTFENVNFKTIFGYPGGAATGSDYAALYSKNTTYNNCSFSGGMLIGRDGAVFNGCTFNDLGNEYIRTYGNVVTFDKCTFNTDGKALLVYSDGNGVTPAVSVTNCTFNATKGAKAGAINNQNCAAIEIDNYGCGVVLTTSGNTIDDDFSGVWRIKTYHTGKESVTINGVEYTQIAIDGKLMTIDSDKNVTVAE